MWAEVQRIEKFIICRELIRTRSKLNRTMPGMSDFTQKQYLTAALPAKCSKEILLGLLT